MKLALRLLLSVLLFFSLLSLVSAEEKIMTNLEFSEFVIATGVEDLTPQNIAEVFSSSHDKLYAFCRVSNAQENTTILHQWYYGNKLMATVPLLIKSASWRTYSSKNIIPAWTGEWRVDITTEDGLLLASLTFYIEKFS